MHFHFMFDLRNTSRAALAMSGPSSSLGTPTLGGMRGPRLSPNPSPGLSSSAPSSSALYSAAAAARTQSAFASPGPQRTQDLSPMSRGREETVQCPHCLKRVAKTDASQHQKTCTLRMETCKYCFLCFPWDFFGTDLRILCVFFSLPGWVVVLESWP